MSEVSRFVFTVTLLAGAVWMLRIQWTPSQQWLARQLDIAGLPAWQRRLWRRAGRLLGPLIVPVYFAFGSLETEERVLSRQSEVWSPDPYEDVTRGPEITLPPDDEATTVGPAQPAVQPQFQLHINTIDGPPRIFPIGQRRMSIGRSSSSQIRLADCRVSRIHAEILQEGSLVRIRDANSSHGLFVNDHPYKSRILEPGDRIKLGNTELIFVERNPQ